MTKKQIGAVVSAILALLAAFGGGNWLSQPDCPECPECVCPETEQAKER